MGNIPGIEYACQGPGLTDSDDRCRRPWWQWSCFTVKLDWMLTVVSFVILSAYGVFGCLSDFLYAPSTLFSRG